jgi:hypothetical protein
VGLAGIINSQPHFYLSMLKPVHIDVFYPIPEGWAMCNTCELMISQANLQGSPEARALEEYPPDLRNEFEHLSAVIYALANKFSDQVIIKIWDPRSFQGLIRSIRYGIHHYPAFMVNGESKINGFDTLKLEQQVQIALERQISAL